MKLFKNKILIFFILFYLCLPLYSNIDRGVYGISFNYPGIGIKYVWLNKNIFELRIQYFPTENYNTSLLGIRYYRIFSNTKNIKVSYYFGTEGAFFVHNERYLSTEFYSANGWLLGTYVGIEKFISKKFSLNIDIGPYFATASTNGYSKNIFDFVINMSINYYWRK